MSDSAETPAAQPVHADEITPRDMPAPTVPARPSTQGALDSGGEPSPAGAGSTPAPAPSGEVDRKGVPFDPAKHNHRLHPLTGCWMPRGGRKPRLAGLAAGAAPPGASAPAAASFIPPEEPPAPESAPESAAPAAGAQPGPDTSGDAADLGCRAVQFGVGLMLRAPEECTAAAAEHKHMTEALAAYIRARGWHLGPGLGLLVIFGAWLMKVLQQPRPRATFTGWFAGWFGSDRAARARDVTPADDRPAGASTGSAPPAGVTVDIPAGIPPLASS